MLNIFLKAWHNYYRRRELSWGNICKCTVEKSWANVWERGVRGSGGSSISLVASETSWPTKLVAATSESTHENSILHIGYLVDLFHGYDISACSYILWLSAIMVTTNNQHMSEFFYSPCSIKIFGAQTLSAPPGICQLAMIMKPGNRCHNMFTKSNEKIFLLFLPLMHNLWT